MIERISIWVHRKHLCLIVAVMGALPLGCGDPGSDVTDPDAVSPALGVTAMTQNLYVGATVNPTMLASSPSTIPFVAAEAFAAMLDSQFPSRAAAIAREIGEVGPHVVALQEVSLLRTQSPGDVATGGTQPATDVVLDFLTILLDALRVAGLDYGVASIVENADVEFPMITPNLTLDDVRLTDFDAILVRNDVQVIESTAESYTTILQFVIGSDTLSIRRGFAAVRASIDDRQYRFVSTHLEPADLAVQEMQTDELIARWASDSLPVVLMGDFNSPAPLGASYQLLLQAGYLDSWTLQASPALGYTCCQAPDLRNETSALSERIDLILVSNPAMLDTLLEVPRANLVGAQSGDRTTGGLWPSDHAGVWAQLLVRR